MGVKIRQAVVAMFIFMGAFTMLNYSHVDINERYNVTNNKTASVQEEYEELQGTVKSDDSDEKGLVEKIKTLSDPLEDPFATIGAGLFVVPQIISLLLAPLDIMEALLGDLGGILSFVPEPVRGFIYIVFVVIIVFGIIEAYLRLNEV